MASSSAPDPVRKKSRMSSSTPEDQGLLQKVKLTGNEPTMGSDSKLLIGNLISEENGVTATQSLRSKKKENGINIYIGNRGRSSSLSGCLVDKNTKQIVLDLGEWEPDPKVRFDKTKLGRAISSAVAAKWENMKGSIDSGNSQKPEAWGEKPKGKKQQRRDSKDESNSGKLLEEDFIKEAYEAMDIQPYKDDFDGYLTPWDELLLATFQRRCSKEGVDMKETDFYRELAATVAAERADSDSSSDEDEDSEHHETDHDGDDKTDCDGGDETGYSWEGDEFNITWGSFSDHSSDDIEMV